MIGQTLSHYSIIEKIGAGGMGEVYVAKDTKLSRKVALKVLPPEMAENAERRARFEREAKAVAALDHPNIVTIHSVEEAEGVHFYTMQLVKGKTITELIPKKGVPLNKFFEVAIPLADAVSAAHEQGIIHRDLKPDNLMVGDDGRLKILDFGLAKLKPGFAEEGASELPTQSATAEGRILGTAAYMSPEQAEGKTVDTRSDIFSIGIILYEMATGERPFKGDTAASLLSSILRDKPQPATEVNPALPRDLGKIIRRCLAKSLEDRLQTAKDLRNELRELKQEVDSGSAVSNVQMLRPESRWGEKRWRIAGAAMALVVLAFVGGYLLQPEKEPILRFANPIQVTTHIAREGSPSWSPDGQTIAYHSDQDGDWDIWVQQIGSTQAINRTDDHSDDDKYPSWSPDGRQIAFHSSRDGGGVFVMPAIGGTARKVASRMSGVTLGIAPKSWDSMGASPQWSADGKELAFPALDSDGASVVEIVSLGTSESRKLAIPGGFEHLSWSADGRYFAYVTGGVESEMSRIWILCVADGESFPVTDGRMKDQNPTWSADGRALNFVSNRGGSMDLWRRVIGAGGKTSGEPQRVTTGIGMQEAVFSPDGSKLLYSRGGRQYNIWRVPILSDRPATWADSHQLTFEQAYIEFLDVSPDGQWLLFSSNRSGNQDLWKMPAGGGEMQQLTVNPTLDWCPRWSPDGEQLAFYSFRSGNRDIWVMPVGGGPARQVTYHEQDEGFPAWSPDSQMLAFGSRRSGNWDIWVVPAEGGEARQLTKHPDNDRAPEWSLNGKWVYYCSYQEGEWHLFRASATGGESKQMTSGIGSFPKKSPDGKRVFFLRSGEGTVNIWALPLEDGKEYAVTDLSGRPEELGSYSFATDGEHLYFTAGTYPLDLWVMDVVRE